MSETLDCQSSKPYTWSYGVLLGLFRVIWVLHGLFRVIWGSIGIIYDGGKHLLKLVCALGSGGGVCKALRCSFITALKLPRNPETSITAMFEPWGLPSLEPETPKWLLQGGFRPCRESSFLTRRLGVGKVGLGIRVYEFVLSFEFRALGSRFRV